MQTLIRPALYNTMHRVTALQNISSRNDVYTVKRKDKKHFNTAHDGRPNVLIDDHIKNIEEWRVGGGLGVHHTSADSSIKQLKSIGFK